MEKKKKQPLIGIKHSLLFSNTSLHLVKVYSFNIAGSGLIYYLISITKLLLRYTR